MSYEYLHSIGLQGGINTSAPPLSALSQESLSDGSWNAIVSGEGFTRAMRGFTSIGANSGSRKMFPVGKTFGGIKDITISDKSFLPAAVNTATDSVNINAHGFVTGLACQLTTTGTLPAGLSPATTYYLIVVDSNNVKYAATLSNALGGIAVDLSGTGTGTHTIDVPGSSVSAVGNFFEDIGRSRWGIGAGQPHIEGTDVADFVLTTLLQVSVAQNGIYSTPVQAGLSQPSAPDLGIVDAPGDVLNPVSCKVERRRPSTGARSLASPTSAVVNPQGKRLRVTFSTASPGQTHWRVYFTFSGFGGKGVHYLCNYAGVSDIPESVVAAGTVDGINRSLEFNFKDGDLIPVEASYDDYPASSATHAIRLGSVMNLCGAYSDSLAAPTATNPGTTILVSKINNYESYVPTHLLYLPEQVTDTLARPIDDYGYIACENSIHALQFVGYRGDELPPCTITTILPDIGVKYPHNWCHFRGRIAVYTAEGNLLLMTESGEFDTAIAAPIARTIKDWSPENTIVGYCPRNDALILANGKRIFVYSLQTGVWRQVWLPDYAINGTVLACTTAQRKLYISVTNGGSNTAYSFDTAAIGSIVPVSFVSNVQNAPSGNSYLKDIYELALAAESGTTTDLAVCLAKNAAPMVFRRVIVTIADARISNSGEIFTADMVSKRVLLFGENLTTPGTHFFHGKVSFFTSATNITLTDLSGTPFNPTGSFSELLMFVGDYTATAGLTGKHPPNFFPNLPELRSYQLGVWMRAAGDIGNVLAADVFGTNYQSSRAK